MLQSSLSKRASANVVTGPSMVKFNSKMRAKQDLQGISGNKVVSKKSRLHLLITDKVYDQI